MRNYDTTLSWVQDTSDTFSYTIVMSSTKPSSSPVTVIENQAINSSVINIDNTANYQYTLTITKNYFGHSSVTDTIVFESASVDTSVMDITVNNPSTGSVLNAQWVGEGFTGNPNIVYRKLVDKVSNSNLIQIRPGSGFKEKANYEQSARRTSWPVQQN